MKEWVISIIGVVFLDVVLDVLVPAGKTSNIIKSVLAIAFIYVMISPVLQLTNKNINFEEYIVEYLGESNINVEI